MTPNLQPGFPMLSVLIFSPLAAAVVAAFIRSERALRWWTLAFTTAAAVFSLGLYPGFDASKSGFQLVEQAPWITFWHIQYYLGIDGISLVLVLLTTLVMPLCVLASWRYIQTRVKEFMICLLVMETAMVGVFCALDFVLFFVFWEAMLIPMALLIGVWGGPRRIYASLKFFIYTMSGSVFLLVAIIALYQKSASLASDGAGTFAIPELMKLGHLLPAGFQNWVFLAFFISFAIKVPMFPFHTWLPAAHVEAPTAGSVLLASILLKMGTYGFLRFSLPITPEATHVFTPYLLALSIVAILYGGLTALGQTDLKKLVAYSSVAHMGFATLGIFALNQPGLEGALLVMINHGVTTGALFIVVGIIYERLHTRELALAAGMGKFMPLFAMFTGVFALSSLAFPGTNSFIGELLVLKGGFAVSKWMMVAVVPGVVLAAAYMLRMLQKFAYGGTRNPDHSGLKDLDLREIITLAPLFVLVFWIGLQPAPFVRVMRKSIENVLQQTRPPATTNEPMTARQGYQRSRLQTPEGWPVYSQSRQITTSNPVGVTWILNRTRWRRPEPDWAASHCGNPATGHPCGVWGNHSADAILQTGHPYGVSWHRFMQCPNVRRTCIGTMNLCSSGNRQSRASEFSSSGGWSTLSSGERAGVRGISLYIKHYWFKESPHLRQTCIGTMNQPQGFSRANDNPSPPMSRSTADGSPSRGGEGRGEGEPSSPISCLCRRSCPRESSMVSASVHHLASRPPG